jgi:Domain of unknown function (DUF5666)
MTQGPTGTPDGSEMAREFENTATIPQVNGADTGGLNDEAFDVLFGGEIEKWPEQATKKGLRASWPIATLVALLLIVGGVWIGSYLQRQQPSSATTAAGAGFAAFAGRAGLGAATGATGATGAAGASSASSDTTSGTVTDIIGNTVYVTNSSGALVKVTVSSTTTVDRDAASSVSGLRPGDTVTVQGSTAKNGTVSAATISATAKGVTAPVGGGFAGFGGGGAGAAAGG